MEHERYEVRVIADTQYAGIEATGDVLASFAAYIQGAHFTQYVDHNGDFTPGGYEACRDLAFKYRDETTGQLWRLNLNA